MDTRKRTMIQQLVVQIEQQLGWGSGSQWSNKDFEALSEVIFEKTKKRLSVTTLKRIWGRAELIANPSLATLDILSEFVGKKNWREYSNDTSKPVALSVPFKFHKRIRQALILGLAVVVVLLIRSYALPTNPTTSVSNEIDASKFKFKSTIVSTGLPNSVVFEYDASSAQPDSDIQIQQDWDDRKRITINQEDTVATCIYYRPGFFKSKLVVNESIVLEDDVFITSEGWLGTINKDEVPIYLKGDQIYNQGAVGVQESTLESYDIDARVQDITTSLYFIDEFADINTTDFQASLEIKNDSADALGGCQEIEIYLLYDGGAIGIPLAKKGCISNLNLMAFNQYINGKSNDLSSFGVSFDSFEKLSFSARANSFKVWVNEELAYELDIDNPSKSVKGISVHFAGTGSVKNVTLENSIGNHYPLN